MRLALTLAALALTGCAMQPMSDQDRAFLQQMQLEQQRAYNQQTLEAQRALINPNRQVVQPVQPVQQQRPGVAFLKSSYTSGQNRICVYDRLGSQEAYTVASYELCPQTR